MAKQRYIVSDFTRVKWRLAYPFVQQWYFIDSEDLVLICDKLVFDAHFDKFILYIFPVCYIFKFVVAHARLLQIYQFRKVIINTEENIFYCVWCTVWSRCSIEGCTLKHAYAGHRWLRFNLFFYIEISLLLDRQRFKTTGLYRLIFWRWCIIIKLLHFDKHILLWRWTWLM